MSRDRRAQPARVLEADVREHLHLRRDHVRGVVAPAEAGLDHRDLHPGLGQLAVRGGRQRLELRHAVVGLQRAVDLLGRPRGARDRGGEALGLDVALRDPDALGERHEVRRQVGAGAQPVALQDRAASSARSTTCRSSRRRGSSGSAPAASRARSSAGACGPGRTACRRARARAGSARPARAFTAPPAPRAGARACRARPARPPSGALATKPSLASLPSARAISACSSLALGVALARLLRRVDPAPDLDRAAGRQHERRPRRRARPSRSSRASRATASPLEPVGQRRRQPTRPALTPAPSRQRADRRHRLDHLRRPAASAAVVAQRLVGRGQPAAGEQPVRARARCDHSSSVTNGMTGWHSASVSRSTYSAVALRSRVERRAP